MWSNPNERSNHDHHLSSYQQESVEITATEPSPSVSLSPDPLHLPFDQQRFCQDPQPPPKPLLASSIEELSSWATLPEINSQVGCHLYMRAADRLFKQGMKYWQEDDLEYAFIYLLKFVTAVIEDIPRHPLYQQSVARDLKADLLSKANQGLAYLEEIKGQLMTLYEQIATSPSPPPLEYDQLPISPTELISDLSSNDDGQPEVVNLAITTPQTSSNWLALRHIMTAPPAVQSHEQTSYQPSPFQLRFSESNQSQGGTMSTTQEPYSYHFQPGANGPLDRIQFQPQPAKTTIGGKYIPANQQELDLMLGLRKIKMSAEIPTQFLRIFTTNTNTKIESCAILSGKMGADGYIKVTTLIIPKQSGTAISCHDLDEVETFTYQTTHGLMPVGWIHTHPTQDCFLSSVDLHMQYGFQVLLPEAVAIVMAPRRQRMQGIFRITRRGMRTLGDCRESGFHPHLETGLYQKAEHVELVPDDSPNPIPYEIVDLRY